MTPSLISRRKRRRKPGYRAPPPSPMSPASIEAIGRFVRILARCGATSPEIVRAVRRAAVRIPASWAARAGRVTREMEYAPHTLTRWFSEAAYQDPLGKPRALPFEGPSGSVAALVRSVDPRFHPREVLDYLVRGGAIRRLGRRYIPRGRGLFIRGAGGPDYFHTLRVLTNMLSTLEHNLEVKPPGRGWFVYVAENRRFPVRARAGLDKYVARLGKEILFRLDAYMLRREVSRRPGEPTMGVGVGMNLWEEDATTAREEHGQRGSRGLSGKRKIGRGRRS
jgi:uncharacterized protein DUF6502